MRECICVKIGKKDRKEKFCNDYTIMIVQSLIITASVLPLDSGGWGPELSQF